MFIQNEIQNFPKKGRGKNIDTNIQDLWEITLPISRRFIVRRKIVFIRSRRGGGGGGEGGEGRWSFRRQNFHPAMKLIFDIKFRQE